MRTAEDDQKITSLEERWSAIARLISSVSGLLAMPPENPGWMDLAACRTVSDPDTFYTKIGEAEALRCCGQCPVMFACREAADQFESQMPEDYWAGVWGGEIVKARKRRRHQLR